MAEVSKLTTDRLKVSKTVNTAFGAYGESIAQGLAASVVPPPEGFAAMAMRWLGESLTTAESNLRAADIAHTLEAADDAEPRTRRDLATREARNALVSASDSVRGIYGVGVSENVGLEATLPDRPDQVNHLADTVVKALRAAPAPTPLFEGASLSLETVATRIESKRLALQAALDKVALEERELQTTMSQRDQATARWSRTYAGVAMILSGLATLAGLDDLASKVKPTERKRAGIAEEGEG